MTTSYTATAGFTNDGLDITWSITGATSTPIVKINGIEFHGATGIHRCAKDGYYSVYVSFNWSDPSIPSSGAINRTIFRGTCDWYKRHPGEKWPNPNPGPNPGLLTNAFPGKSFLIAPECSGNISVNASIESVQKYAAEVPNKSYSNDFSWSSPATITLSGNETYTLDIGSDSATSMALCEYVPAFYDSGSANINYTIGTSGAFDLTWDLVMYATDNPAWYPYNTASDSEIMKSMIASNNRDSYYASAGKNTPFDKLFNISKFPGLPPFTLDVHENRHVKMAVINPRFYITCKNNLSNEIKLNNVTITFNFAYNEFGILTNIPIAKQSNRYNQHVFWAPNAPATREIVVDEEGNYTFPDGIEDMGPFYMWGVLDGYITKGSTTYPSEIVRIYGHYNQKAGSYEYPTSLNMVQVDIGDSIDAPLYRTENEVPTSDWWILINSPSKSEHIEVITPQELAKSEDYRSINVSVKSGETVFASDTIFVITTTPNEDCNDLITNDDLTTYISRLRFYDADVEFATYVEIERSKVASLFYERMGNTYRDSVVLQSGIMEPLNFVEFAFNDYATFIPIYDGQIIELSDDLRFATDGVRCSNFVNFSHKIPNIIKMKPVYNDKYKVKFNVSYEKFKDMFTVDETYLSNHGI